MSSHDELIADTQRRFRHFGVLQTPEESRQCIQNMVGLLRLLYKWQNIAVGPKITSALNR